MAQIPRDRLTEPDLEIEEPLTHHARVKQATTLDDYLDEEVVDKNGKTIGTLSCYWEGDEGALVFCGVKIADQDLVRVVPGDNAQISERHSWVRLGFSAATIRSAPSYDCDQELDGAFERNVYQHYGIENPQSHTSLRYASANR